MNIAIFAHMLWCLSYSLLSRKKVITIKRLYMKDSFLVVSIIYVLLCIVSGVYAILINDVVRGLGGLASSLILPGFFLIQKLLQLEHPSLMKPVLLLFTFLAFHLGVVLQLYSLIGLYDVYVHALSGLVFTLVGLCVYFVLQREHSSVMDESYLTSTSFAFFFSQFIAVIWEIFEYVGFLITGHDSQNTAVTGIGDTMGDMIACMLGSLVMASAICYSLKRKRNTIFILPATDFYNQLHRVKSSGVSENETAEASGKLLDSHKGIS